MSANASMDRTAEATPRVRRNPDTSVRHVERDGRFIRGHSVPIHPNRPLREVVVSEERERARVRELDASVRAASADARHKPKTG